MSVLERLQSVFVALAALLGLAAGIALPIGAAVGSIVLPALLLMITAVFLQMDAAQVRAARDTKKLVAVSLVINFMWTPLFAWMLGAGLLGGAPDLRIGLLLLLVTPCTDWYLVFTALARGHLGGAAALLPINLVLQLLLLPVYVLLLGGEAAMIGVGPLFEAIVLVLAAPLVVAVVLRWLTAGSARGRTLTNSASRAILPLLYLAVFAMFAWQGRVVADHGGELLLLLIPLGLFFVVTPLIARMAGSLSALPDDQRVTLTMTTVARNSPIALALAVAAFPDRPLIAVALVIGPLVELPVLALLSQLVRRPVRA
ncbi:arsenic resistance protein [Hoyosella sp. YIM 151337]|uniref:arsenic resistance protein n=1 Tax=Hoyosella sp. YIM 151337 TaxID=2992742 RepID=UPI002235D2E6|nr:arsenic resistance protein [Hoyosella sp. YIM 151337]MCW4356055.1 arsenic resistance protein [Hoyosella sp. YIM 151337]